MERIASASTRLVGFWSAVSATVFSILYVVGQLAEWTGLLGSAGGPESSSTVTGIVVLLTPSLLLGPAFLLLVVSIHQLAAADRKIWGHAAMAFATAYASAYSAGVRLPGRLAVVAPPPRRSLFRDGPPSRNRSPRPSSVSGSPWRNDMDLA